MTQEDKELLIKDLSARLHYGVKCHFKYGSAEGDVTLGCIDNNVARFEYGWYGRFHVNIDADYIKPYLRPMSSMTEEENTIFNNISNKGRGYEEDENGWVRCDSVHTKWGVWPDGCAKLLDYLNSIHVDYRCLIEKGLAIEAPEGMYNLKEK